MEKSLENIPTPEKSQPISFMISDMEKVGVFKEIVDEYNESRLTVDSIMHADEDDARFLEHKVIDKIHGWHGKDEDELSIDKKKEIIIETFKEIADSLSNKKQKEEGKQKISD